MPKANDFNHQPPSTLKPTHEEKFHSHLKLYYFVEHQTRLPNIYVYCHRFLLNCGDFKDLNNLGYL